MSILLEDCITCLIQSKLFGVSDNQQMEKNKTTLLTFEKNPYYFHVGLNAKIFLWVSCVQKRKEKKSTKNQNQKTNPEKVS